MFKFLKKLTQKEKENLVKFSYNEEYIYFKLNSSISQNPSLIFYQNLFSDLIDTDIIIKENDELFLLSHNKVYQLLDDERSHFLPIPKKFTGKIEVTHRGLLNRDAKFVVKYFDENNQEIFNPQQIGTILEITKTNFYILPESIFKILNAITLSNNTSNTAKRYQVIELIQSENDKIIYRGLQQNDFVNTVKNIAIDVIEQDTGDLDLYPRITGLTTDFIIRNSTTIANHQDDTLVLTYVDDNKKIRYLLQEKQLQSAKTLVRKKIPKSQAQQFKLNPEAFFDEEEIETISLDDYRLIRVTGLRSEPYIGFFGSNKIETPMSQVLTAGEDIELINRTTIIKTLESFDDDEIEQLQKSIQTAKIQQKATLQFRELPELPLIEIENIVEEFKQDDKDSKRNILQSHKETSIKTNSDDILAINPNDEEAIAPQTTHIVSLTFDDTKLSSEWHNISKKYIPKQHQLIGFNWLKKLYKSYQGGLLADDMGLGKTFQIIAFLNYLYNIKKPSLNPSSDRILIVAPSILLTSWENEIDNVIIDKTAFNVKILQGKNRALKLLSDAFKESPQSATELSKNNIEIINLLKYNIFITTYETLSKNQLAFAHTQLFNFKVCIFDEAQKIKNPNARTTQAAKAISANIPFTIIVTGTPIENELRDLWSLFDTFDPTYIGSWKSFRETYVKPLNDENNLGKIEKKLRTKIGDYMLRRLKKDHLKGLPKKIEKIIDIQITDEEVKMHQNILNSELHHMEKLQKLRALSLHPILLNVEKNIAQEDFSKLSNPETFFKTSKMHSLIKLLDTIKNKQEKVLIFVIRHAMQTLLQTALQKYYEIQIDIINGKNNKQDIVDIKLERFQNNKDFNILILSPLAAGVGLTITSANHVIHLERHWNPAKEDQASDRVYRIGQEKDVFIYHFIQKAENFITFDMGLNQLISSKKSLSTGTLIPTPSITDREIAETFFSHIDEEEKWALMSPEEFETEVMILYEKAGYTCHKTSKQPTESGTDIVAVQGDKIIAIQCKHTRKRKKQNNTALYQLISEAKIAYPNAEYVAVTNYYFNANAHRLAEEQNIKLIELDQLLNSNLL